MTLESIAKTYGMNDYYDMNTGRTYQLSKAFEDETDELFETLSVPVLENGNLIGYAKMNKVTQ